jgi:hypothetical protein
MAYFTTLLKGEPHEPKTAICVHHSYNKNHRGKIVFNIFSFEVFKEDKQRNAKPVKWSEEAVRVQLGAHLYSYGIDSSEKY